MKRNGKEHYLTPKYTEAFVQGNNLCVQRSEGLVNIGIGPDVHKWVRLTPTEAALVIDWLLKAASKAERYTPDE